MQSRNDRGRNGSAPTPGLGLSGANRSSHSSLSLNTSRSCQAPARSACSTLPSGASASYRRRIFMLRIPVLANTRPRGPCATKRTSPGAPPAVQLSSPLDMSQIGFELACSGFLCPHARGFLAVSWCAWVKEVADRGQLGELGDFSGGPTTEAAPRLFARCNFCGRSTRIMLTSVNWFCYTDLL
jgi:hypothetical protein